MAAKRVLSVGQCSADQWSIERLVSGRFGAEVIPAHTTREALEYLRQGLVDLVLVNRVFDRDGGSGLDLITRIKTDAGLKAVPVMLVSNYEDAQTQAVERGALPGFGKAALSAPETLDRLGTILGEAPSAAP